MPKQFYEITSAPPENEDLPRQRVLPKRGLHLCAQPGEAAPHVGHSGHDPDMRVCRKRNHRFKLSSTARTNAGSAQPSTLTSARPGNSI